MIVYDLTHTISENMPVYPGTETPKLKSACTLEANGFRETLLQMYSHTGTHIDAPAHMFKNGASLDSFDGGQFVGIAAVIDCTELGENGRIDLSFIDRNRALADKAEFLLFRTGWDKFWGGAAYFEDFPCITGEVADYIAASGKKGVGLDTVSIDPVSSTDFENHRKILGQNKTVIIENLCGLDKLSAGLFGLIAAPLKFTGADGAPARVFVVEV